MSVLRVGIIGTGGIARGVHIPNYLKQPDVEVVACSDIVEESAKSCAEQFNIGYHTTDYRQMLKDVELDIVSVCTPNFMHKDPVIAAFEAGVNVMCEKPIGMNADEGRAMVAAGRKAGKMFAMGLMTRQQADMQALKRAVDAGDLGDIYFAKAHAMRRRGIPGWGVFGEKDKQGGGPLIDIGVHIMDSCLWLMGHPKPTAVSGKTYTKFGNRKDVLGLMGQWNVDTFTVEDFAVALVRFENGATMEVESSFAANIENDVMDIKLLGDKGGASLSPLKIYTEKNKTLYDITPVHLPRLASHEENIKKFVQALRDGGQPPVTGEEGLMVTEIIDAIYKSSDENREVQLQG